MSSFMCTSVLNQIVFYQRLSLSFLAFLHYLLRYWAFINTLVHLLFFQVDSRLVSRQIVNQIILH